MSIEDRIKRVMHDVLGVAEADIDDGSSPETIAAWDSVQHMTLLLALEEELGVTFADADLPHLTTFAKIRGASAAAAAAA